MKKILLPILVAVGIVGSASASVLTGNLTNGLVAYYSLAGNASDSYGSGNTGVVYGATPSIDRFGNPNSAYSFNGANENIEIPGSFPSGNSDRTISIWFKPNIQFGSLYSFGYQSLDYIDGRFSVLMGWGGTDNIAFVGAGSNMNCYAPNLSGNWHLCTIISSNSFVSLFIDSGLIGSGSISLDTRSGYPLVIGASGFATEYFNGSLSDLGIWNTALTPQQVSQLYALQSVPEPSTYALFGLGVIGMLMVMRRKKSA
jgi:hypothetical protein